MPNWMAARVTEASRVEARFSKSLARRRFRPSQEKVRSTTHRRLMTSKPTALRLRRTTSSRSPLPAARCRLIGLLRIVARVGEDALQPRKAELDLAEQKRRAVSVLNACRMDDEADRQAQCVDERVDLAPFHLLSRLVAHRVGCIGGLFLGFTAPFSADLIVWLSMMPAEGDPSRPSRSRSIG